MADTTVLQRRRAEIRAMESQAIDKALPHPCANRRQGPPASRHANDTVAAGRLANVSSSGGVATARAKEQTRFDVYFDDWAKLVAAKKDLIP